jgi:hypothetical protein
MYDGSDGFPMSATLTPLFLMKVVSARHWPTAAMLFTRKGSERTLSKLAVQTLLK